MKRRSLRLLTLPVRLLTRIAFYYPKVISALVRRAAGKEGGIVEVVEGTRHFGNGRYAIFLVWQPKGVPWYVQNALDALREAKVNVILVANHTLSDDLRLELAGQCTKILIRDNSGFDIGGYKDATLYANSNFDVDRMIYLNDSVYFFRHGLTEMFERLAGSDADICSAFENWERHHHIQSFCFSLSSATFKNPKHIAFWQNYLPVSARRWAIHAGEIGVSRALSKIAQSFDIIYSPNDLRPSLEKFATGSLLSLNNYLPITQRFIGEAPRMRDVVLIEELLRRLASRSQVHTGGFLFHRFLNCPIIKRDLVYRLQFTIYDVEQCLKAADTTEKLRDILSEMRKKGPGTQLPLLKRIQFLDGVI